MRTFLHVRSPRDPYFQVHPLHGSFSVITTMLLAGLVVLMLVMTAR
jgi:hypothetical protein